MLSIADVGIVGYRSVRKLRFPVGRLGVFVGANGVGKTNLYRALQLAQAAAGGSLAREIAAEGGMSSAFWAGKRNVKEPVRLSLSASFEGGAPPASAFRYDVAVGFPKPLTAAFPTEPNIKTETLVATFRGRPKTLLHREGPSGYAVDADGARQAFGTDLMASETALGSFVDAARFPDLYVLRQTMSQWRFYHDLRTDSAAPLRRACLAVATPTLSSDGSDLAAVFATLAHIREDTVDLDQAISDAFPGARLEVPVPKRMASFGMVFPDHPKRVFEASELSDGTLRYLALMGALLGYRLPPFIALNEPETSLHPDLLPALGRLIARASERSQIWLVTHSERLADVVAHHGGVIPRKVIKRDGETWIEGLSLAGEFEND